MTTDEIIEMARQAASHGVENHRSGEVSFVFYNEHLMNFAKLVAAKATDEANARSNASWTLMCKKMVEDERNACAELLLNLDLCGQEMKAAEAIRARAQADRGEA